MSSMTEHLPPEGVQAPLEEPPVAAPSGLTFADGVQFGCGFMVAVTLSLIILILAALALVLILSLFGISIL